MQQISFFKSARRDHGGALSISKRRSRRPLSTKHPIHLTLRSELAKGPRALTRHRPLVNFILKKSAALFRIRVYQKAICGNHLHFLVRGKRREDLQNFFRVLSGHIAQEILRQHPLQETGGAPKEGRGSPLGCLKNRRKFWDLLLYSRLLTWGREFRIVHRYIQQNTLEAMKLIAYTRRKPDIVPGTQLKLSSDLKTHSRSSRDLRCRPKPQLLLGIACKKYYRPMKNHLCLCSSSCKQQQWQYLEPL